MKTIAIVKNKSGECIYIGEIENATDKHYQELQAQVNKHRRDNEKKERELNGVVDELKSKVLELEQEIKVLKGEE